MFKISEKRMENYASYFQGTKLSDAKRAKKDFQTLLKYKGKHVFLDSWGAFIYMIWAGYGTKAILGGLEFVVGTMRFMSARDITNELKQKIIKFVNYKWKKAEFELVLQKCIEITSELKKQTNKYGVGYLSNAAGWIKGYYEII